MDKKLKVGVALGSGSARGLSHIGVLKALEELQLQPDIVCGCSSGAIVGAAYVANNLDRFETWVLSLQRRDLLRFFEINLSMNGVMDKTKIEQDFNDYVCARRQSIEGLSRKFATVATDLESGQEIWLETGLVMDAVFSSIALPGLFAPYYYQNKWLVDGGLLNPVPASLCRALGADVIIAVNLNELAERRGFREKEKPESESLALPALPAPTKKSSTQAALEELLGSRSQLVSNVSNSIKSYSSFINSLKNGDPQPPGLIDIFARSINIMQKQIATTRLQFDAPDVILSPKVNDISLLEFHRARDAIDEGYACVQRVRPELEALVEKVYQ
ncbi:patatin-like phospholipase family protein [Thiolinea disciformis]|uniref:patatin-like phospholipase family protein n=1 Tax=Thiolinea disciformis TaxID=125614 RepID=UPI000375C939|nr:patatin-like phospholipase family protein [Thiolinea disciformis]